MSASDSNNDSEDILISEDRKVNLISDVDQLLPEKLKKQFSLIEEIVETNKETLPSVFQKIEESGEQIKFVYSLIEYAFKIRPLNTESLCSLYCLLSQKHEDKNIQLNKMNVIISHESEIIGIIKQDDLNSFIKKSSDPGFNPKLKVEFYSNSPIVFIYKAGEVVFNVEFSYLQAMALYGAVKCFKHAILSKEYYLDNIEKYAVAGGNIEIIHILEQRNISFENCLEVSIKFHRNELSDWILTHYKCLQSSISNSCSYYNYRAALFGFINGIPVKNAVSQIALNGHLDLIKYLYETCHADVKTKDDDGRTPIIIASEYGHIDIVKYLYETCHVNVETKEDLERTQIINNSENGCCRITKYLYETRNADVKTKDDDGSTPISIASKNGHLEVVKYLYETCHANVEIRDKKWRTPITIASENCHLDIVKYLYEICHAKVPDDAISYASKNGHLDIVKYLYETCHAKIETEKTLELQIPMLLAVLNGHLDIVKYLYKTCHLEIPDDALSTASANGHLNVVKYLVEECHKNVEKTGSNGLTPICLAIIRGQLEVVKYLYETCHAKVKSIEIISSVTKEIKEYFKLRFPMSRKEGSPFFGITYTTYQYI